MKLGDFLSQSSQAAPTKPVKFRALGVNPQGEQVAVDAEALLTFVNEHDRQESIRDARAEMAKRYQDTPVPDQQLNEEASYQVLFRSLKTTEDPRKAFADNVRQLRNALTLRTVSQLMIEYSAFAEAEFSEAPSAEVFEEMIKEAEKSFFPALRSRFESSQIRAGLLSLARRFGA